MVEEIGNESDRRKGSNGNVECVITKCLAFLAGFAFLERFHVETEDFSQQAHACLRKNSAHKPQPEEIGLESLAEVIGNACAEEVGQRSEE